MYEVKLEYVLLNVQKAIKEAKAYNNVVIENLLITAENQILRLMKGE